MLHEAGILRSECVVTNVVNIRPPANRFGAFCVKKAEIPKGSPAPFSIPIKSGEYLAPHLWDHLERLRVELTELSHPNIVIALGNVALWAVCHIQPKISAYRGTCLKSPWGFKVLPTYHPAAILREYSNRIVSVADLIKARVQSEFPEINRPHRRLAIAPASPREVELWLHEHILPAKRIVIDIENPRGPITCVGLAPSPVDALCIPFVHSSRPGMSYWSREDEFEVWQLLRWALSFKDKIYEFQNGLYDLYHLWRQARVLPLGTLADTMVKHHAMYPEMPKGLGFLGAAYTDEPAWKQERPKGLATQKEDE